MTNFLFQSRVITALKIFLAPFYDAIFIFLGADTVIFYDSDWNPAID